MLAIVAASAGVMSLRYETEAGRGTRRAQAKADAEAQIAQAEAERRARIAQARVDESRENMTTITTEMTGICSGKEDPRRGLVVRLSVVLGTTDMLERDEVVTTLQPYKECLESLREGVAKNEAKRLLQLMRGER